MQCRPSIRADPADKPMARTTHSRSGGANGDRSLAAAAYARLEELIVTRALAPGEVVSEIALSGRLGIGRTPIREALHRLARERLVVIQPRRGIVVTEVDTGAQLRLLEVRREIERFVARCAAKRATEAERLQFNAIADAFEAAARGEDATMFLRADRAFNDLCLVAVRNEYASGCMARMHSLSRRFWLIHFRDAADMPHAASLHADVARAIARGHGEAAATASDALIDYLEDFTRSLEPA